MQMTRRLGGYHILATIGHGGMGELYLAIKDGPGGSGKLLVVKALKHRLVQDPEFLAMFLDEGRIAARLNHPHVVQTFETGRDEDVHFIVMEYLDGVTLNRVISESSARRESYSMRFLLTIISHALSGLHYAHETTGYDGIPLQIVHRDATPENIFITYDGAVKVMDFGIAKALDSRADTEAGVFKGKLGYLPPEQFLSGSVDRRADVFSLGVVLWEILAGRRMYRGKSEVEIMNMLTSGNIPGEEELPASVPGGLKWIVARATSPNIRQRYPSAREFQEDLEDYLQELGGPMSTRELSDVVTGRFSAERETVQRCIEHQLRLYHDYQHGRLAGQTPAEWNLIPRLDVSHTLVGSLVVESSRQGGFGVSATSIAEDVTVDCKLPTGVKSEPLLSAKRLFRKGVVPGIVVVIAVALGIWVVEGYPTDFMSLARMMGLDGFFAEQLTQTEKGVATRPVSSSVPLMDPRGKPLVELTGEIEEDAVLTNDREYLLKYNTYVRDGVSLMVQAGTVIRGDAATAGTLIVQPGARIIAQGTPDAPIVFTSARPEGKQAPGDWGGVIVLGLAPVNNIPVEKGQMATIEGIASGGEYGGNNPDDDSGILEYVRIEYAGREIAPNNEINGLTFGGVGRFTRVNHVQVRHVLDDCFEFFGGTVDARYLICQSPGDDGFDWDLGYTGRLQFLLLTGGDGKADGANGLEGDNDPRGTRATPVSAPKIYNATLCGQNDPRVREHFGILARHGTQGEIGNSIITGFAAGYDVRNPLTRVSIVATTFFENLQHTIAYPESDDQKGAYADDDGGFNEYRWALRHSFNNSTDDPGIPGCIRRVGQTYKPEQPVAGGVTPPEDDFFDTTATYRGAFRNESDNWDSGAWVKWL